MSVSQQSDITSDIAIQLSHIVKIFDEGKPNAICALNNISARIKKNTITGLVGSDASGKTTLLRLMAGLLSLTQGKILVEGLDPIINAEALRYIVGYMPQKFGLYEDLTVIENLVLYANLRGVIGEERNKEFSRLLNFTQLGPFVNRRARNLSGGMKQKLGLACALLGRPKVLLLDEPSVGVDPISRRELWKMVNELIATGMTVIWSTSYLYEAELCHEVLVLNNGTLLFEGPPQTLTQGMTGRSIQIQDIQANHRLVLQNAMRLPEVIDGVIQGSAVRLVLAEKENYPNLASLHAGPDARIVLVKPRFEDAFMNLLGGVPKEEYTIIQAIELPKKNAQSPSGNADIVIEANQLTKKFGTFTATDHISFQVKRGEIFCLLGPNGAGKSTTFKMLCGLLVPTSGSAEILGIDLQKHPHLARQQLGYMAQKFSLYGDLTVEQNMQFFAGIYGLTGEIQTQIIEQMISIFDLKAFVNMKSGDLPLGFKQRLALACAIMHNPPILFLDEPTSGVDPIARREFWARINHLVEKGVTVLVTTHFMDEAEYCDRMILIYRGIMIATGTPEQLKQMVKSDQQPNPTMEDAFIELIKRHDEKTSTRIEVKQESQSAAEKEIEKEVEKEAIFKSEQFPKDNKVESIYHQLAKQVAHHGSLRRLFALCQKEYYQIIRDPSSIFMAFILPLLLLFIYGFGINLDTAKLRLGIVMNDLSPEAYRFEKSYADSPYIQAIPMLNADQAAAALTAGDIRGFVMIQSDFSKRLTKASGVAPVQVFTDGSEPNTANFVSGYAKGAWQTWLNIRSIERARPIQNKINTETRYWYNPAAISRYFLVPGSIALVMTIIGALLTSLVVAREWETGTMESLLSTPVTRFEFLLSKLIPYYLLGIIAMIVCLIAAITVLATPFRGSIFLLFIETTLFLGSVLGLGLFLSSAIRNQFNAAQAALNIAYLPAIILSGFVFEISSMPLIIQGLTYLLPARYFVSSLQTLFLAGNVTQLLLINALFLAVTMIIFISLAYKYTSPRLD